MELYDANYNIELLKRIKECQDLCFMFNQIKPSDEDTKKEVLKQIFGKEYANMRITAPFYCDYGKNIILGDNFYANYNLVILDAAKVTIGNNVFIGPNCCITTSGHPIDKDIRNKGLEYALPITIGDDVWIGANVVILPNVKIGNNVVIGAGSVVNKDIENNCVAVGTPCKPIRKIKEE